MNGFSPWDFDLFNDLSSYQQTQPTVRYLHSSLISSKPVIKNPLNSLSDLGESRLEVEDPTPDIWEMFHDFDQRFFNGNLIRHGVQVDWSPKMTTCAGLCRFQPSTLNCSIKLSKPLLQLRPRKDLVETLIHEMIHALLFVLRESDNRESHGPKFHENMYRINQAAKLNITVYHSFHDEVNHYLTHIWRCNGPCQNRAPFFGWVKRAMNRKPGPHDTWWKKHQDSRSGEFVKVSEPEKAETVSKKNQPVVDTPIMKSIKTFFPPIPKSSVLNNVLKDSNQSNKIVGFGDLAKKDEYDDFGIPKSVTPFNGTGKVLGSSINNPHPGKSILLTKFGNMDSTLPNLPKRISSTVTISMIKNTTQESTSNSKAVTTTMHPITSSTDRSNSSFGQLIVINDESSRNNRRKSPSNHFDDDDAVSSKIKKPKLNETIILSEDEDDDDDDKQFDWLKDVSDEDLLRISQPNNGQPNFSRLNSNSYIIAIDDDDQDQIKISQTDTIFKPIVIDD